MMDTVSSMEGAFGTRQYVSTWATVRNWGQSMEQVHAEVRRQHEVVYEHERWTARTLERLSNGR